MAMLAASFEIAPDASMKGKREQWLSTEQVFRVGIHAIACCCLSSVSFAGGASGGTQITLAADHSPAKDGPPSAAEASPCQQCTSADVHF